MQWEQLTSTDFAAAVRETGVCILTFGVIEKHSEHLPLGTDYLNGHRLASLAAEREPAVVFPPFYFGQIYEARCFPGTITLKPTLLLELIFAVLDEIGRNGFKKIILLNAHGGNAHLLPFIAQASLAEQKPYTLYYYLNSISPADRAAWDSILDTDLHGHACECETSTSLANHPELIHMERVPEEPATPRARINIPGIGAGVLRARGEAKRIRINHRSLFLKQGYRSGRSSRFTPTLPCVCRSRPAAIRRRWRSCATR